MVMGAQRTALYAYYAQGNETFYKLRRFLIELVGNDISTNATLWKGPLESGTIVPIHNGVVDAISKQDASQVYGHIYAVH